MTLAAADKGLEVDRNSLPLQYAVLWQEVDEQRFHEVLRETMRLDGRYPRLESWIRRVGALPRA